MFRVHIYQGCKKILKKSGVGRAMEHQEGILRRQGLDVNSCSMDRSDIVHINSIFPDSVIAALWARSHGSKIIWYGHSTMEDFKNSFRGSNLFAPLFKRWITFCYGLGDVVITPTPYSKSLIESYGVDKPVYALSNGIDTDFWGSIDVNEDDVKNCRDRFRERYHLASDEKVVMSVGHFIHRKGITEFIDLANALPEYSFFWFGHTNLNLVPDEIRLAIEMAPSNMHFPGYVGKEELREAYQACDLFCFMSHEETEGIVVLEALAGRIPVVLRDIPVYNDWLQDGLHVYKCQDQEDFEERVCEILEGECRDLTEAGYRLAMSRDYDLIGRRLMGIYQDVMEAEMLPAIYPESINM